MKPQLIKVSALLLFTAFFGCQKNGDIGPGLPVIPVISYDLITGADSASWFAQPGSTSPDSVRMQSALPNGGPPYTLSKLIVNGRVYLQALEFPSSEKKEAATSTGLLLKTYTRYVHLNHRDTDTLRIEVLTPKPGSALIYNLAFYYNNRLSANYDFRATPAWNDSLTWNSRPTGLTVPLHKIAHL